MREVGVVYRIDILLLGGLYLYWQYRELSHDTTTSPHVTSMYYPITTALHKDAKQCNNIALGTLGFTRGREPEAP